MKSVFKTLNPLIIFALFLATNFLTYLGINTQSGQALHNKEMVQIIFVELVVIGILIAGVLACK